MSARWRTLLVRAVKFYGVGAGGTLVQLGALVGLRELFALDYLVATALAVELSVLHNFAWHERYTWRDRPSRSARQVLERLARFNLTTGALSIAGNLVVMRALVGSLHVPYIVASMAAIAACGLLNFLISDRWVFRRGLCATGYVIEERTTKDTKGARRGRATEAGRSARIEDGAGLQCGAHAGGQP